MFKRILKISRSDFWVLSHDRLSDFYTSAWQYGGSPLPLLLVRFFLAAASVGFLAWSQCSSLSGLSPYCLIYLTNWGWVVVTAMAVTGLFVSMVAYKKPAWQYGRSPLPLLLVRFVLATVSVGFLAWSLSSGLSGLSPLWLIYLTNWGLVLVTAMAVSGLFVSAMVAYKMPDADNRTPWYVGLFWVIFNVAQTIAIAITVLYWTLLYDANNMIYATNAAFWLDVATHGFNSVITVSELLVARTPVRWLHAYQPLLLAIVYVGFSGIYYATDGTNGFGQPFIYPVLDWREPGMAGAVAGGSLLGVVVVHTLVWALAAARDRLSAALFRSHDHDLPHTHDKA